MAGMLAACAAAPLSAADVAMFSYHFGGGLSNPVGRTAAYSGTSGSVSAGVDYNFDPHNSLGLEVMWAGMPHQDLASQAANTQLAKVNLYALTTEYRYKIESFGNTSRFGVYAIGGGGLYFRYISVNATYISSANPGCQSIDAWYGLVCGPNGVILPYGATYKFENTGGLNAGAGVTIRLSDSGWKFYTEARYHHAFSTIPTSLVQITFGFRYN